jgi:hypothetical protein
MIVRLRAASEVLPVRIGDWRSLQGPSSDPGKRVTAVATVRSYVGWLGLLLFRRVIKAAGCTKWVAMRAAPQVARSEDVVS